MDKTKKIWLVSVVSVFVAIGLCMLLPFYGVEENSFYFFIASPAVLGAVLFNAFVVFIVATFVVHIFLILLSRKTKILTWTCVGLSVIGMAWSLLVVVYVLVLTLIFSGYGHSLHVGFYVVFALTAAHYVLATLHSIRRIKRPV